MLDIAYTLLGESEQPTGAKVQRPLEYFLNMIQNIR